MPGTATKRYQNTTVRVPRDVYELAKNAISRSQQSSFNEFVVEAIEEKLRRLTESEIDAAFAQMAEDADYQRSSVAMAGEFEKSDWEALQAGGPQHTSAASEADSMRERKTSIGRRGTHGSTSKARSR